MTRRPDGDPRPLPSRLSSSDSRALRDRLASLQDHLILGACHHAVDMVCDGCARSYQIPPLPVLDVGRDS